LLSKDEARRIAVNMAKSLTFIADRKGHVFDASQADPRAKVTCNVWSKPSTTVLRHTSPANAFLGHNAWWSIRIRSDRISQLKWIAAYQVDPIRAITHVAPVLRVEPSTEPGKEGYMRVVFAEPAKEIKPIPYGRGIKAGAMRGPRYTSFKRLSEARSLADLLRLDEEIVWELISRPEGATVAEIRRATGYTGAISSGPKRAAERHGYQLLIEGKGEHRD
jgi:hypothetical protein